MTLTEAGMRRHLYRLLLAAEAVFSPALKQDWRITTNNAATEFLELQRAAQDARKFWDGVYPPSLESDR